MKKFFNKVQNKANELAMLIQRQAISTERLSRSADIISSCRTLMPTEMQEYTLFPFTLRTEITLFPQLQPIFGLPQV